MTTKLSNDESAIRITISFVFSAAAARRVSLTGDFNNWDLEDMPMFKGSDGVWYLSVSLTPGRHEYRFIADGVRQGNENCVKIVSAEIIGGQAKPRGAGPGEPAINGRNHPGQLKNTEALKPKRDENE